MPCMSETPEEGINRANREINRLTRVCCDMRTVLRRMGLEGELTVESRKWIAEHDDWDRRRVAMEEARGERERVRQRGLDKLTLDERRALGLYEARSWLDKL